MQLITPMEKSKAKSEEPRLGPEAWCNRCHRKHRRGADCGLELAERVAKSGRKVMRLVHPIVRKKGRRKTKARKT